MFKVFTIKNFKCFDELKFELDQFNLISGKNNAGKTSLLEALLLHLGTNDPRITFNLGNLRGADVHMSPDEFWGWFFTDYNSMNDIEFSSIDNEDNEKKIVFSLKPFDQKILRAYSGKDNKDNLHVQKGESQQNYFPNVIKDLQLQIDYFKNGNKEKSSTFTFLSDRGIETVGLIARPFPFSIYLDCSRRIDRETIERFSRLEESNKLDIIIKSLRVIENRLTDLTISVKDGVVGIKADVGIGKLIPISLLGQGIGHLLSIVLAIGSSPKGIVLIDEIENGLHHSVLQDVWHVIIDLARETSTQVIATTHSMECISAAHSAFLNRIPYDFKLHRLERIKDRIELISYDKETMETSIEMNLEVR